MKFSGLAVVLSFFTSSVVDSEKLEEICALDQSRIECGNAIILIERAQIGIIRSGKCKTERHDVSCIKNITDTLQSRCSGRKHCRDQIDMTDLVGRGLPKKCVTDPKIKREMVLSVRYRCLPVEADCDSYSPYRDLYFESGETRIISSLNSKCKWRLHSKSDRGVLVTIRDFPRDGGGKVACGTVKAEDADWSVEACGEKSQLFFDQQLTLSISDPKKRAFIVFIKDSCSKPVAPKGGWIIHEKQRPDVVWYRCNASSTISWRMDCKDGKWINPEGNRVECPKNEHSAEDLADGDIWSYLPHGIWIAIILGSALIISVTILTVGLVMLRRQREKAELLRRQLQMRDLPSLPPPGHVHKALGVHTLSKHKHRREDAEATQPLYTHPPQQMVLRKLPTPPTTNQRRQLLSQYNRDKSANENTCYFELEPKQVRTLPLKHSKKTEVVRDIQEAEDVDTDYEQSTCSSLEICGCDRGQWGTDCCIQRDKNFALEKHMRSARENKYSE